MIFKHCFDGILLISDIFPKLISEIESARDNQLEVTFETIHCARGS
jgi:hypothetical protein